MQHHRFEERYPTPAQLPPVLINDPALPLISIVTPSYNQGAFIRETITSVLGQDYPNIEYWVIDGGSSDETLAILHEYASDPRLHWISERDRGQSDAINKGLARCRGAIFTWLNSDDVLLPGALQRVAAAWQAQRSPVLIYGLARLIDQASRDLGYCPMQSAHITLDDLLWYTKLPMQPATFMPTEVLRSGGGVDTSLHYAMDFDLWVRLAQQIPFCHIPYDLALYRLHANSKTVALSLKFVDDFAVVLQRAVQQGLLTEKDALSRHHLFIARANLLPEVNNIPAAFRSFLAAIATDYALMPRAVFVLGKGLSRLFVGERFWSQVRFVKTRLSHSR